MSEIIEVVEGEEADLALHTKLCSLRYQQLLNKFDQVDQRLDALTALCADIKDSIVSIRTSTQTTYLKWAGFIIVFLSGLIGGLISHVIK
jgi:hypothetical protein